MWHGKVLIADKSSNSSWRHLIYKPVNQKPLNTANWHSINIKIEELYK